MSNKFLIFLAPSAHTRYLPTVIHIIDIINGWRPKGEEGVGVKWSSSRPQTADNHRCKSIGAEEAASRALTLWYMVAGRPVRYAGRTRLFLTRVVDGLPKGASLRLCCKLIFGNNRLYSVSMITC